MTEKWLLVFVAYALTFHPLYILIRDLPNIPC